MKIHSPNRGLTGTQTYGSTILEFMDGVATVNDDLTPGVKQYLIGAGYGIDADPQPTAAIDESPDPRAATIVHVGAPLQDASLVPDAIEPDDLPTRTVPELRGYAAEYGINVDEAKTKAAIVHAIRTHFAALPDRQDEQA